ncbi:hypothetical protein [Domibacillus tundrae]|uniref:hypothetical protein n=1 Tax=Domibacillus tundrae TaxID=1587527 RepID=UPI00339ADA9F
MDLPDIAVSFKSTSGGGAAKTPMGLAGQLRSDLPQSGGDELSACSMESEAARAPAALSAPVKTALM